MFNYSECLFGRPKTLSVRVVEIDRRTGIVKFNGADSAKPTQPFTWEWGDGQRSRGFFPQIHRYRDTTRNYVVRVTAHHPGGKTDSVDLIVRFHPSHIPLEQRAKLRSDVRVAIPSEKPRIRPVRAPYGVAPHLAVFDDRFFQAYTRETVEYVLTVAAVIKVDLANDDVCKTNGRFEQVVLRDPGFQGMYSIWYTEPKVVAAGDYAFTLNVQWSSLFHEMGHNVTLNSPARFHWGFRTDGPGSSIYSETLAQIFQHATAYEAINNWRKYGFTPDLVFDIARSACESMRIVRRAYENYRRHGCRFCSWNDPMTGKDETFDTFMTVAYKFFEHAERIGQGYRVPVKRLMAFLQRFNPDWERRFNARSNSKRAEQFRATLMVAALSYAFNTDLRSEFRNLGFPIDDVTFWRLLTR